MFFRVRHRPTCRGGTSLAAVRPARQVKRGKFTTRPGAPPCAGYRPLDPVHRVPHAADHGIRSPRSPEAIQLALTSLKARIAAAAAGERTARRSRYGWLRCPKPPRQRGAGGPAAGQMVFGENRVQEAAAKIPCLALRLAGAAAAPESVACKATRRRRLCASPTSSNPSTAPSSPTPSPAPPTMQGGCRPAGAGEYRRRTAKVRRATAEADAFIDLCRLRFGTKTARLMCIPPPMKDRRRISRHSPRWRPATALACYRWAMSSDFEIAIARVRPMFASAVRCFGARQ